MSEAPPLLMEKDGSIGWLIFNRPDKRNAVGVETHHRMGARPRQPRRHVRGPAPELHHVQAGDVGQQPCVGLGDRPDAPRRLALPMARGDGGVALGIGRPVVPVHVDVVAVRRHS